MQTRSSPGAQAALFERPVRADPPAPLESPKHHIRIDSPDTTPLEAINRSMVICGDATQALKLLPDRSVQTVVTSPPYWSLRDYGVEKQIGRDDSIVLDPFAGSGTTLLAARELGRRWVGIEIKPAFVDLIERRLRMQ